MSSQYWQYPAQKGICVCAEAAVGRVGQHPAQAPDFPVLPLQQRAAMSAPRRTQRIHLGQRDREAFGGTRRHSGQDVGLRARPAFVANDRADLAKDIHGFRHRRFGMELHVASQFCFFSLRAWALEVAFAVDIDVDASRRSVFIRYRTEINPK